MKKLIVLIATFALAIGCAVGLAACAEGKEYKITCVDAQNGYVTVADTEVNAGEKVILASHPDAGYKFTSFTVDGEEIEGCSFVMPEKDVTVSANFEILTYTITYVQGDTTVEEGNPETYTVEDDVTLIQPQKEGYEYCGWYTHYTESELDYGLTYEDYRVTTIKGLVGNLTLYAKYYNSRHEVLVDYDIDNGSIYVDGYYDAYYGDTFEVEVNPDRGYELVHITVNGEVIEGTAFTVSGDVEISAEFKAIEYKITYVLDGGTATGNPEKYTIEDFYISLTEPEKEGYYFEGWYLNEENSIYFNPDFYADDYLCNLTLYARFEEEYDTQI